MGAATSVVGSLLSSIGVAIGGDGPKDITIVNDDFYERVLRDGEMGLGESYQDGWWEANQLDEFLTTVIEHDLKSEIRQRPTVLIAAAEARIRNRQSVRRSQRNAAAHYDIGNDLYERMLDKRMIYSCGYWQRANELDSAQEDKLDLICRKLQLEPGMRLLDIGCGWGGFAQFAAERYAVEVTGITPSRAQYALAKERCQGQAVRIELADYRTVTGSFDRIVSIGMFEHVGPRNHRAFFDRCDEMLTADGLMLHHTIGGQREAVRANPWVDRYIFPGGVLPSLAQIATASCRRWVSEDVHNFGPDYDRTLMAWHDNVSDRWSELPTYDDRFRRTWDYYLLSSAAGFRSRSLQLWQIVFRRTHRRTPSYESVR